MSFNLFKKVPTLKGRDSDRSVGEKPKQTSSESKAPVLAGTDDSLVLKGAHVTEKSGFLNNFNQYVFKVATRSNKIEIKKAVEKMYGVKVDRVMISVMPSKKRRLGRFEGEKSGFKKAVVKLSAGHKIDVMPK